jgi:hypothetical protein
MALNTRPVGITVVAALAVLGGIFMVFGGRAIVGLGAAGVAAGTAAMRPGIGLLGAAGGVLGAGPASFDTTARRSVRLASKLDAIV